MSSFREAIDRLRASPASLLLLMLVLVHSFTQVGLQSKGYTINNAEAINLRRAIASVSSEAVTLNATEPVISSTPTTSESASTTTNEAQTTVVVIVDRPSPTPRVQRVNVTSTSDDEPESELEREEEREEEAGERREEAAERRLAALRGQTVQRKRMARHKRQMAHVRRQEVVTADAGVTQECADSIKWAAELVTRSTRQDIAFIAFSLWLVALVNSALLWSSVPHLVALALSSTLACTFVIVQIVQTVMLRARFRSDFAGPCNSTPSLFTTYWTDRLRFEIASAALQWAAFIAILILGVRIRGTFNWSNFKSIGASLQAARMHRLALIFQVLLQLAAFFIITFQSLWINELLVTQWTITSFELSTGFIGFLVTLTALVLPWLVLGWLAITRRSYRAMAGFLAVALILIGNGLFLLADPSALLSRAGKDWAFLRFMGATAAALLIAIVVVGLACLASFRLSNAQAEEAHEISEKSTGFIIDFPTGPSEWGGDDDASSIYSEKLRPTIDDLPPLYVAPALPSRWSTTTRTTELSGGTHSSPRVLC